MITTVQEIKQAIARLPPLDRDDLELWIQEFEGSGNRVAERAMKYEVTAEPISVERYIELEQRSDIRHEYINGALYAMSGASEKHEVIAGNIFSAIHGHVRGKECRAYIQGFKVRIEVNGDDILYYPDVMVACTRKGIDEYFLRYPKLVIEVLSPSTESIDRREKRLSYTQIPTVEEYALFSQRTMELIMHRKEDRWMPRTVTGTEALVDFRSIDLALPLAQVYEGLSL